MGLLGLAAKSEYYFFLIKLLKTHRLSVWEIAYILSFGTVPDMGFFKYK